jgi:aminoglycoside 2'-N-acetyltransferase I
MSRQISYRIVAEAALDAGLATTIAAMDKDLFRDHPFGLHYEWAPAHFHALATLAGEGGRLVGHADLTERAVRIGEAEARVVGLGTVMTAREQRGRGVATGILDLCEAFVFEQLLADYAMLFCAEDIVPFYARRGWLLVGSPVTVEQPGLRLVWPHLTMLLPRAGQAWQEAPIDIGGLPW